MKKYICFYAGGGLWEVEPYNEKAGYYGENYHIGNYNECNTRKHVNEYRAARFTACLPSMDNVDSLLPNQY